MKKKIMLTLAFCLLFVGGFALKCYASSNTITKNYGIFSITCYINCANQYGSGYTKGAPTGYNNYVGVTTYNINDVAITSANDYHPQQAYVYLNEGTVYKTRTSHAVADGYVFAQTGVSQIILVRGRE